MNNRKKIQIFISLLVIILLGSYYLGKIVGYNEQNNIITKINETKQEYRNIGTLGINEFKKKIDEDYILIDLRTPGEIADGYIKGVDLKINYYDNDFKSKIEKLDKTKKYLIYCHSGSRSGNTLYLMKNLGFKDVHDLSGGINGWIRAGQEIIK